MSRIGPLQFFRVVPLHSPYMLLALAAVGALGVVTLTLEPAFGDQAVAPVVLLQMFAASSGFALPARRGHYDLLLTGGAGRLAIAVTHLMVSVLPGLGVWLVLGMCEIVLAGTSVPRAFSSGSVFAFAMVSLLAWAITVPLPRLSGGIIWLTLVATALASSFEWRAAMTAATNGMAPAGLVTAIYLLCPFLFVGQRLDPATMPMIVTSATIAAMTAAAAMTWMTRMSVPLEAAQ